MCCIAAMAAVVPDLQWFISVFFHECFGDPLHTVPPQYEPAAFKHDGFLSILCEGATGGNSRNQQSGVEQWLVRALSDATPSQIDTAVNAIECLIMIVG